MMNGILVNVLSAQRRARKPLRVRNPKRIGELTLVLPPRIRKRALKRRARKVQLPHARPRFFKGKRLSGVEIFAKAEACPTPPVSPEISIDAFALQPDGPPLLSGDAELRATLEAIVYVTEEPVTAHQIAAALELPLPKVTALLEELAAEYAKPHRGVSIRSLAGGYKMSTKPEFHEGVRRFVRSLKPPLKLSMAALETLAVIAYKQPITAPEILEIRGVQGAGVLKTLLDKKLITTAGRKNVVGRPMMYKTTREFLVQFGLNSTGELPTLKEFEELKNLALSEAEEIGKAEAGIARYQKYAEAAAGVDAYAEQSGAAEEAVGAGDAEPLPQEDPRHG
ncbi:MAG: SMC-Scp complex subunit ScpB [Bryobacterales bacterium]|jgi:segregation and condensation protein B|nr:SMC-Scp complex subunit ScpB [Bryobacterales bacterium]